MNVVIDPIVEKWLGAVERHRVSEGVYSRWLWQNEAGTRELGPNEYGCADAANIRYTLGDFPRDAQRREMWVRALQDMQDPETGLFRERTHHPIHTTAHCVAALELFDARPRYPLKALLPYLDVEKLCTLLDGLDWVCNPWSQSHQGAGVFAALTIAREAPLAWQDAYFDYLRRHCDPERGMSRAGSFGGDTPAHHLYGWFHYLFNHESARRAIPYPERLIDTCVSLYESGGLGETFGLKCDYQEIDWVYCIHRASRQTAHRRDEVWRLLRDFAGRFVAYLLEMDAERDESVNDLHMLFGGVCTLAELQMALPGELRSTVPLRLALDRRPFI